VEWREGDIALQELAQYSSHCFTAEQHIATILNTLDFSDSSGHCTVSVLPQ